MTNPATGLGRYKSKSIVQAAKIVTVLDNGCHVRLDDDLVTTFYFTPDTITTGDPKVGDYWAIHEVEGVERIWPAELFERLFELDLEYATVTAMAVDLATGPSVSAVVRTEGGGQVYIADTGPVNENHQ